MPKLMINMKNTLETPLLPILSVAHINLKKNHDWRFLYQAKGINQYMKKTCCPLPRSQDLLDLFAKPNISYNSLDLAQFYFQIPVSEEYSKYYCCVSPHGLFQPLTICQGECNAVGGAQFVSRKLTSGLKCSGSLVDNLAFCGSTHDESLDALESLLAHMKKISEEGKTLKLRPDMVNLISKSISFLGKTIVEGRQIADTSKLQLYTEKPQDVTSLSSFISYASFF